MTQQQIQKPKAEQDELPVDAPEPVAQPDAQRLSAATDELLDEIDAVLETNAAEFVAAFVQHGGQ